MTATTPHHHLFQVEDLESDQLAMLAKLQQFFGRHDDCIEPFDVTKPLGPKCHSNVVAVDLGVHLRYAVFRQSKCIRRDRRSFQNTCHCIYPNRSTYPGSYDSSSRNVTRYLCILLHRTVFGPSKYGARRTILATHHQSLRESYARLNSLTGFNRGTRGRQSVQSNPGSSSLAAATTRRFASARRRAGQQPAFQRLFQSPSSSPHREGRQQQCDQSNRASSLAPSLGDACEMKGLINFALGENEPGVIVRHRGRLI